MFIIYVSPNRRKIYESSDATLQLVDFYKEISSPLLANVDFLYLDSQIQRDSLTKTNFNIFFEGKMFCSSLVSSSLFPTPLSFLFQWSYAVMNTLRDGDRYCRSCIWCFARALPNHINHQWIGKWWKFVVVLRNRYGPSIAPSRSLDSTVALCALS